jgi:hypothetical protein
MNVYSSAHKKFIPSDSVDIVSAENITPEGRHYIMYLRLKQDRIPVTLVPYDTQSAYHRKTIRTFMSIICCNYKLNIGIIINVHNLFNTLLYVLPD